MSGLPEGSKFTKFREGASHLGRDRFVGVMIGIHRQWILINIYLTITVPNSGSTLPGAAQALPGHPRGGRQKHKMLEARRRANFQIILVIRTVLNT